MEQNSLFFWLIAALLTLLTIGALATPLLRRAPKEADDDAVSDIDIYKSQLAEVERDLARGVLDEEAAERTRTEIARRVLAADKAGPAVTSDAPQGTNRVLAGLLLVGVLGAAGLGYLQYGAPGYGDLPRGERIALGNEARQNRPTQFEAEAAVENKIAAPIQVQDEVIGMIEQLREIVPTRPDDINGWQLLATNEGRLHNYAAAAQAQARVVALSAPEDLEANRYLLAFYSFIAADGAVSPDLQSIINEIAPDRDIRTELWESLTLDARSIGHFSATTRAQERYIATLGDEAGRDEYADLLDYMVSAANGVVSPEAETIAVRLLQQDEDDIVAHYYAGLLYAQTDRPDLAFNFFRRVVEKADPDSLHYILAASQIEDTAWLAGVDYTLQEPSTRGPSAADMAAAANMSEEERAEMIGGMVANLSQRLAEEGGTPDEWAQLIRALGTLGQTDRAAAIWNEAQEVFATSDEAVATIRAAAEFAGVAE